MHPLSGTGCAASVHQPPFPWMPASISLTHTRGYYSSHACCCHTCAGSHSLRHFTCASRNLSCCNCSNKGPVGGACFQLSLSTPTPSKRAHNRKWSTLFAFNWPKSRLLPSTFMAFCMCSSILLSRSAAASVGVRCCCCCCSLSGCCGLVPAPLSLRVGYSTSTNAYTRGGHQLHGLTLQCHMCAHIGSPLLWAWGPLGWRLSTAKARLAILFLCLSLFFICIRSGLAVCVGCALCTQMHGHTTVHRGLHTPCVPVVVVTHAAFAMALCLFSFCQVLRWPPIHYIPHTNPPNPCHTCKDTLPF